MRKYRVLIAAALLLLLAGCQNPAPVDTAPPDTMFATAPEMESTTVQEATNAPETEPTAVQETTAETETESTAPTLEEPGWELAYGAHLYKYTGAMDIIDLPGYSLSLPENWKDRVTVFSSDHAGYGSCVYIVGNALLQAYEKAGQEAAHSSIDALNALHEDYLVMIVRTYKDETKDVDFDDRFSLWQALAEDGLAVMVSENDETAYFVSVNQTINNQGIFSREILIDKIGQEAYDELLDGLLCTLEEAAAMISVTE